jgi:multiple sugar transport system ATP-binding protein
MAEVQLEDVSKIYGDGTRAVNAMNLEINDGEFMVLVGPSGCGKTTALRMVAGLEEISEGTLRIGDRIVNDLTPRERDIAMVFQSYALYPHLTVYDNIAFSLKLHKLPKAEIEKRVTDAARILDLEPFLKRKPKALSGGQRQRVAMGRAIVREPQAFLMDEPLSNLDAKLRVGMRTSLQQLHNRLGTTTVYVTHDQVEAMTLGQRVAVMRDGKIQQVDAPQRLYEEPANTFVAAFIGSPSMNLVRAHVGDTIDFGRFQIPLHRDRRPSFTGPVILGIRPEAFEDSGFAPRDLPRIDVAVEVLEELGSDAHIFFPVDAEHVVIEDALADDPKDETSILADERDRTLMVARVDARTEARIGGTVSLAVDPSRLYFFSPATGESMLNGSSPQH